jgi:hypothetical protein
MLQPGLARAVPMGILGFLVGGLLAFVIRTLQGLDSSGLVGSAMVLGAFISAGAFVWGMGGFDAKMQVHGDHAHEEPEKPEVTTFAGMLGAHVWTTAFWLTVGTVIIGAIAFLPQGPSIRNVHPGEGDVISVGSTTLGQIYNPLREFGTTATGLDLLPPLSPVLAESEVSYLVILFAFVIIMLISLFLAGGLFAGALSYFLRGKRDPNGTQIPWRVLAFIFAVVAPVGQFPLLISGGNTPMALLVPIFLIPPLLVLIGVPSALWVVLLVVSFLLFISGAPFLLAALVLVAAVLSAVSSPFRVVGWIVVMLGALSLPVLVPTVNLLNAPPVLFALIGIGFMVLFLRVLRNLLADNVWRIVTFAVLGVLSVLTITYAVLLNRGSFWDLTFNVVLVLIGLGLLLPVEVLKMVIPAAWWQRFGNIDWVNLVPQFAAWVANLLRSGLPVFLGQK